MSTSDANLSSAAAIATPMSPVMYPPWSRTMTVLIRRELWEHRSLWITPLIVAGLLLLAAIPLHVGNGISGGPDDISADARNRLGVFTLLLWAQTVPQYFVMTLVLSFYLMDCLYQERKDRSILFWKSLPVSDATTVVSKFLVALVVAPLGVYLTAMVASVLFQIILAVRIAHGSLPNIAVAWDTVAWLKVQGLMLYGLVVCMLWFAPLAAALLLVSAWARKNVFLWTTLPPVIAIIMERIAFGTRYTLRLLQYRTWGIWDVLGVDPTPPPGVGHGRVVSLADLFDDISMGKAFLNIDLWFGLAVAAVFIIAAVRIRRYRDDT
jgi:ABC-2 type transport system permease protein